MAEQARAAYVYDEQMSPPRTGGDAPHEARPPPATPTSCSSAYGAFEDPRAPYWSSSRVRLSDGRADSHSTRRLVHRRGSAAQRRRGDRRGTERFGFSAGGDNPVYAGMYEAALLSTGASVQAACLVADGTARAAFAPAGGLHHAASGNASGFCIFNDPVVAINALRERGLRVVYVDIDAHHGDGVQTAFYRDRDVMTISMHEGGRWLFPRHGRGLGAWRGRWPGLFGQRAAVSLHVR